MPKTFFLPPDAEARMTMLAQQQKRTTPASASSRQLLKKGTQQNANAGRSVSGDRIGDK